MNLSKSKSWNPPSDWIKIQTIDMHTGGEPLRIPVDGFPELIGNNILEKRRYCLEHLDHLRTTLMFEPRGHADMYGALLTEPITHGADFGTLFIHNEGYSTMCGHAIIALTKFAVETGMVEWKDGNKELLIDAPPGLIRSTPHIKNGVVESTSFLNVPSFVLHQNKTVEIEGVSIKIDVAYGGAFYALVEAEQLDLKLGADEYDRLISLGKKIKKAVTESLEINHPFEEDLSFLYGTIFTGKAKNPEHHSRNVCIFAEGEVDRSATGSGVSARAALHFSRGEISVGQSITIESILDTTMDVEVAETAKYGEHDAVVPQVTGTAHFSGKSEFWIDPNDPLQDGFIFR